MNCQNCPFAKNNNLGNGRFICTKPEGQNTDKVVRGHWEALPECYEQESETQSSETQDGRASSEESTPRTTAIPSRAYKAVTTQPKTAALPSPAYEAVVSSQNKIAIALEEAKKLHAQTEEIAIENKIRAIASQFPWIGSTSPSQRAEFLDGLRDAVRNHPAKETRETSRYHVGYQTGRNSGSIFVPADFLAS